MAGYKIPFFLRPFRVTSSSIFRKTQFVVSSLRLCPFACDSSICPEAAHCSLLCTIHLSFYCCLSTAHRGYIPPCFVCVCACVHVHRRVLGKMVVSREAVDMTFFFILPNLLLAFLNNATKQSSKTVPDFWILGQDL